MGTCKNMAMSSTSMSDALFTKSRQRVLGLLFSQPDRRFYTNEIMRHAAMGRGTIQRELDRLRRANILAVTREGNQNYYQANSNSPIYGELLGITRKTFGLADVIRTALEPLLPSIDLALIYGSIAKGTDTRHSDVDLMVVGNTIEYGDIVEVLLPVEESLGRLINPTIFSRESFQAKGTSFLKRVLNQEIIFIKGSVNDLREP